MSARPVSDKKRTETPNFRMTKGELAMLGMKASIEGVGKSELIRRAMEAYQPTPEPESCVECGMTMTPSKCQKEIPLDIMGNEKVLTITDIPAMRCECGNVTYDLDVGCDIEELVDIMVKDALRYNKEIPQRMTIEELFGEEYLGAK